MTKTIVTGGETNPSERAPKNFLKFLLPFLLKFYPYPKNNISLTLSSRNPNFVYFDYHNSVENMYCTSAYK